MSYLLSFLIALGLSIYLTPLFRSAAQRFGIVDRPDGNLKRQCEAIPYLGGLALYLSFLLAVAFTFEFNRQVLGLLLGGTIALMLGLIDDFGVLSPKIKLLGQVLAAFVVLKSGIYIELLFLPKPVSIAISLVWLVGLMNAFNMIDIMDGLAAGAAFIASIALFIVALYNDRAVIALLTVALSGGLIGFLKYNFEPARIYMGDAGSMFIGLNLGGLSMIGSYTEINDAAFLAPVVILGVPIFDTFFVSWARWRRGKPIFRGSPDHFPLRLVRWGLTVRRTVLVAYGACSILAVLSLVIIWSPFVISASLLSVLAVAAVMASAWLNKIDKNPDEGKGPEEKKPISGLDVRRAVK